MTTRYNKKQKTDSRESAEIGLDNSKKEYKKYVCNCIKCDGKEVDSRTQVTHTNKKEYWNSNKSRKHQLKEIDTRKSRYVTVREEKRKEKKSKKRKLIEKTEVPTLKKDISV